MNEQEEIQKLKDEGYTKIEIYNATAGEVDEDHQHDFDTLLVVLSGQIQITSLVNGIADSLSFQRGANIFINKNTPHSSKVGPEGCRYIVAVRA